MTPQEMGASEIIIMLAMIPLLIWLFLGIGKD